MWASLSKLNSVGQKELFKLFSDKRLDNGIANILPESSQIWNISDAKHSLLAAVAVLIWEWEAF